MTTFDQARPLRQSMSWLHTWSGLTLGWLLFAVYVTGTLSYFRNEITFWMQPELHRAQVVAPERIAYDRALALLAREAPDAQQWTITLPGARNPTLGLSWQSPPAENRQPGAARERPANREGARGEEGARENRGRDRGAATRERPGADGEGARRENRERVQAATRERPSADGEESAIDDVEPLEATRQAEANPPQRQAGPQRQQQGGGGHRGPRLVLDPASGETLEGRATAGGNFLYRFHFELYGMDRIWGRWIVGIATMFMFVALVSGVIVHRRIFKDFFTFRPGKGKRSWLDGHNASSVLSLPFHLIITFSGLVLFGHMMMPTAFQSAYQGNFLAYREAMRARMPQSETPRPSGERAPLTDLAALVAAAQQTWGGKPVGSIAITLPGDRNAVVELRQMGFPSLTNGRNVPALRFNGVTGERLATPALPEPGAVQAIGSALNLLHRGFFATPVPRWLLFLSGVGGSLMIASGLLVWSVARARKTSGAARAPWGHRLVEVLNIASIAGLMVAIAVHFWANRLIPADWPARADWEIRAFFIAWAVTFVHAIARRPKAAWVEQLACAGGLSALLPLINAATGGLALPGSIGRGLGLLAGFDLCALAIGAGLLFAAYKVRRHAPPARFAASGDPATEPGAPLREAAEEAA
ncbi:MAG: PepSY domain-containing protein [Candidatus Accumulibacter sp.]|nr:PepSY domain-containing protein [Accumulibacter sp.]